jgi:hypothetical protein
MAEPAAARGVAPSDLGSYQHAVRLVLTNDLITASRPWAGVLAAVLRWADLMSRDFTELLGYTLIATAHQVRLIRRLDTVDATQRSVFASRSCHGFRRHEGKREAGVPFVSVPVQVNERLTVQVGEATQGAGNVVRHDDAVSVIQRPPERSGQLGDVACRERISTRTPRRSKTASASFSPMPNWPITCGCRRFSAFSFWVRCSYRTPLS